MSNNLQDLTKSIQKKLSNNLKAIIQPFSYIYFSILSFAEDAIILNEPEKQLNIKDSIKINFVVNLIYSNIDEERFSFSDEEKSLIKKMHSQSMEQLHNHREDISNNLGEVEARAFEGSAKIMPILVVLSSSLDKGFIDNIVKYYGFKMTKDDPQKHNLFLRNNELKNFFNQLDDKAIESAFSEIENSSLAKKMLDGEDIKKLIDSLKEFAESHRAMVGYDSLSVENIEATKRSLESYLGAKKFKEFSSVLDEYANRDFGRETLGFKRKISEKFGKIVSERRGVRGSTNIDLEKALFDIEKSGREIISKEREDSEILTSRMYFDLIVNVLEHNFENVAYSSSYKKFKDGEDVDSDLKNGFAKYEELKKIFEKDFEHIFYEDVSKRPNVGAVEQYLDLLEKTADYTKRVLSGADDDKSVIELRNKEYSGKRLEYIPNQYKLKSEIFAKKLNEPYSPSGMKYFEPEDSENYQLRNFKDVRNEVKKFSKNLDEFVKNYREVESQKTFEAAAEIKFKKIPIGLSKSGSNGVPDENKVKEFIESLNKKTGFGNVGTYASVPFPLVNYEIIGKKNLKILIGKIDKENLPKIPDNLSESMKKLAPDHNKAATKAAIDIVKKVIERAVRGRVEFDDSQHASFRSG